MPLAKILCQCRFHKEIDQGAFIEKFLRDESFHRGMKFTISFRKLLVGLRGLEPPTSRLSGVRSNHLSYKPMLVSGDGRRFFVFRRPVVEMRRIELLTPCLQGRCSPS